MCFGKCRERDSNPHSHHWPRDFKSLVSTNSTIAAWLKSGQLPEIECKGNLLWANCQMNLAYLTLLGCEERGYVI